MIHFFFFFDPTPDLRVQAPRTLLQEDVNISWSLCVRRGSAGSF